MKIFFIAFGVIIVIAIGSFFLLNLSKDKDVGLHLDQGKEGVSPSMMIDSNNDGVGLPPDPGKGGEQTLLGIDSDNDGVRDDIQRYIYFTYGIDGVIPVALKEVAKQWQLVLEHSDNTKISFNNATKMARHGECLDYFEGDEAGPILAALGAEVLNTDERSLAYIQYNENLAGEIIPGKALADWKNSCSFDVEAIRAQQ